MRASGPTHLFLLLLGMVLAAPGPCPARIATPDLNPTPDSLPVACGGLHDPLAVEALLAGRDHRPLWADTEAVTPRAAGMLKLIAMARHDGLDPQRYHLGRLRALLAADGSGPPAWRDARAAALAERLLTDACLTLGRDLSRGRLEPEALWEKWQRTERGPDPVAALTGMLTRWPAAGGSAGEEIGELTDALEACRPPHPEYRALMQRRLELESAAARGGWTRVEIGQDLLRPGTSDPGVRSLRRRLRESGDLTPPMIMRPPWIASCPPDRYDRPLAAAVRAFQRRHGLQDDGVVGPATLAELNTSAAARAERVALNLERWRWLPRDLGGEHVRVNIPDFRVELRAQGRTVVSMKAIVGRPDRPTPVVSGDLTRLVLNPYWNVPQKLARKDLLPKIRKDPQYLADRGFQVFSDWSDGAAAIDPAAVDWAELRSWDLAFRFRQHPGLANPLGRVKFLFANDFSVYLHDTDQHGKFDHAVRTFSSGCVRLEQPLALLDALLRRAPARTRELARTSLSGGDNRTLDLPLPVPVHLLYLTAWVDDRGRLQFRPDCYRYDAELAAALADLTAPRPPQQPAPAGIALSEQGGSDAVGNTYQVRTGPVSTWTNPGPE